MDDSNSETMKWVYEWQNAIYDTQRWEYVMTNRRQYRKLGEVNRIVRARQSYDEPVHEYNAWAFTQKINRKFNTKVEAQAWVTACERM
jgi:hypothetical protein